MNDVKKKYRKYALKYHPDRCRGNDTLKNEMAKKFIYYTELHELIGKNITKGVGSR